MGVTSGKSMTLLEPVIRAMEERGWSVHVACGPDPGWDGAVVTENDRLTVIDMARAIAPAKDAKALSAWITYLRRLRPDAVIGATPKASVLSLIASKLTGVPVRVFHVWGARWEGVDGWQGEMLRRLDSLAAACATDVIAVSDSLADLMVENGIVRRRPVVLAHGGSKGVDTTKFRPPLLPNQNPTLGFVGRLSRDKGIDDVIHVFNYCRSRLPSCRLLVIGPVDETHPIAKSTEVALQQRGISWRGACTDVVSELQQMSVLVFPSVREGLPNVVIEASACGVPTVGYAVTGVRDAVEPGRNGLLVAAGDVEGLAEVALQLLEDPHGLTHMDPRAFVTSNFDERRVVGAFLDYLGPRLAGTP